MRLGLKAREVLAVAFAVALGPMVAVLGGQEITEIQLDGALHGYYGGDTPTRLYTFGSDREAEATVERIVTVTGLRQNFDIQAGGVPNAMAAIRAGRRLLIYNPGFIEQLTQRAGSDWAGISVMAHEVGHHLQGHTITQRGSTPPIELEADEFSGFVLARLGASLADTQAAVRAVPDGGSATHPRKNDRLAAIAYGWRRARIAAGAGAGGPAVEEERVAPARDLRRGRGGSSTDATGQWQSRRDRFEGRGREPDVIYITSELLAYEYDNTPAPPQLHVFCVGVTNAYWVTTVTWKTPISRGREDRQVSYRGMSPSSAETVETWEATDDITFHPGRDDRQFVRLLVNNDDLAVSVYLPNGDTVSAVFDLRNTRSVLQPSVDMCGP